MGDIDEYIKVLREKALSDCNPDQTFWTCHGRAIRNIYELADTIEGMNDESFKYHVNDEYDKNDFAQWIMDVVQDGELAHKLKKVRDKQAFVEMIRARSRELEEA